jgi:hypothetical protein
MSEVSFEAAHCPNCGNMRDVKMTHVVTGEEPFLHHTLASLGVPPLHILRANNAEEYRFYELTGDLDEALHFKHFDRAGSRPGRVTLRERIRLGQKVWLEEEKGNRPARDRVTLRD